MAPYRITICRDEHDSIEAFRKSLIDAIYVLIDNGYAANIYYDDKGVGVVCIDYDYKDVELASLYPYWLSVEEADMVDDMRCERR